jgi:hypothetical protein
MAKDPAVLLYTQDFLVGTLSMTDEQRGKYIYLLCLQHQKGRLTLVDLKSKLTDEDIEVAERFPLQADGFYYNQRMYDEAIKRKNYTESRRSNRTKKTNDIDVKKISQSYVNRMENENVNVNVNETVNDNKAKDEVETSSYSTISYTVAKKLLDDLCDWSLSFSMFEEALEEMNGIGFNKLCVLAQLSETEIAKIKECVSIRVEQQN